ncbi:MAG: hypothetical protein HON05_03145 [Euryarchaeota archaeon]|jgi:hypothetical protein|nr:hypothetical protein [Euryarchaeota archaeon]
MRRVLKSSRQKLYYRTNWDSHITGGFVILRVGDANDFRTYYDGDYADAQHIFEVSPPPSVKELSCTNQPIDLWSGNLILCGVEDFMDTFETYLPEVVVTMCSSPPHFPKLNSEGRWLHRDFSGYDLENYNVLGTIVVDVMAALNSGKQVLLHCLHGQDRTGIIGLALVRLANSSATESEVRSIMCRGRPNRESYWYANGLMAEQGQYHRIAKKLIQLLDQDGLV